MSFILPWRDRPLKPYKALAPVIQLDPQRVRFIRRRRPEPFCWFTGMEVNGLPWPARRGRWDQWVETFSDHTTYRLVQEVLDADLQYECTATFQGALTKLKKRGVVRLGRGERHAFSIESDLHQYFSGIANLLYSMSQRGYDPEASPMGLAIGRDGCLIKEKHGHHRLAAAQLLGVKVVSFSIVTIHLQWLLEHLSIFKDHPKWLQDALK